MNGKFNMTDLKRNDLISIVSEYSNGVTKTAIAKRLGKTKANKTLCDALIQLVSDGILKADIGNCGYVYYSIDNTEAVVNDTDDEVVENNGGLEVDGVEAVDDIEDENGDELVDDIEDENDDEDIFVDEESEPTDLEVSYIDNANLIKDNHGWKVEKVTGGRYTLKITTPNNEVRDMNAGDKIVVINFGTEKQGNYHLNPQDHIVVAINEYLLDFPEFNHYILKYMGQNETLQADTLVDDGILIFLEIERHNKSANVA